MSADYKRLTKPELRKMYAEGDTAAGEEIDRRKALVRRHREEIRAAATMFNNPVRPVGQEQAADAIRARDQANLESMMSLLVDLKTAVASLEAKIDKMIGGDDQEH
jgi:hypothetical protein